jgi:hypothetical protein
MAVAAQPPDPSRSFGEPWPSPEALERLTPVLRLMAAIGAIPQVTKLSMSRGDASVDLWVFLNGDDYDAEGLISRAERAFLSSGHPPVVRVNVIPGTDVDPAMLPPTTVLFER